MSSRGDIVQGPQTVVVTAPVIVQPAPFVVQPNAYPPQNFPSRTFSNPLPPGGQHYVIPTVSPYALSVVTAACAMEAPTDVENVRTIRNWIGQAGVKADVTFSQDSPAWMTTPAFSRAAPGQRRSAIGAPRRATILFTPGDDGKLTYMDED